MGYGLSAIVTEDSESAVTIFIEGLAVEVAEAKARIATMSK